MKIAVEGCAHGELDKIYEALLYLQQANGIKIDLLICCGDFQSVRNREDLQCMAVPPKYLTMNTFYKYYSGEAKAPILTVFIGGNHEASNYLGELAYGGWVCPNIYYMGYSGIINVNGIRIAGLSGIYKGPDYLKGHFEVPPYNNSTKRSAYHIRSIDTFRMKQICEPIDVFLSHDWPRGVYNHGNVEALLRKKRFFTEEVLSNKLGSRPNQELLEKLRPSYWFAAHLHVKFAALVPHKEGEAGGQRKVTKFLALDKCLPRRDFLQILDIGPEVSVDVPPELRYDAEWLAILKSTDHLLSTSRNIRYLPGPGSSESWILYSAAGRRSCRPALERTRARRARVLGDVRRRTAPDWSALAIKERTPELFRSLFRRAAQPLNRSTAQTAHGELGRKIDALRQWNKHDKNDKDVCR